MLTENKAYIKIMSEYSQKRSYAQDMCDKEKERIYKLLPRVAEIDREIQKLGLENMGKILSDRENAQKYNSDFESKLKALKNERNKVLSENNISLDFDKPRYICSKCSDTGYAGNEKCTCLKQQLIDYAYDISNMRSLIENQTFDNFDFSFYRDTKIPNLNMSERENIEEIVSRCINFCKNPEQARNLFFYGQPGLGKTFLSSAVAKEMLDRGYTVIYSGASRLFASYDDYRFGRMSNPEDFEDMLRLIYDADLLIIDDLGVEMSGPSAFQFLFDLMNDRILHNKRMIISTNLTIDEMSKKYTTRISSRLHENFDCLRFVGNDIRTQKRIREQTETAL